MKELSVSRRLIMTHGPTSVDPRVSRAMSASILGQFDPDFTTIMNETMTLIRQAFQTTNQWAFTIDGTSRAGLEAVVTSIISKGDSVLVPIFGRFGHLFVELFFCSGHHCMNHATPLKFFDKIHFVIVLFFIRNIALF